MMAYLRDVNTISIMLRMILAMLFAGLIGVERGRKRRPAGFRTHILVCVGATLIMITSQYMVDIMGIEMDISRMGAQVVSGIGFLGVGTIIVVGRNQVKGLTTAAGLWVCACMGLAIGIGFYEGAVITCIFVMGIMSGLQRLDKYVQSHSKVINIYVEVEDMNALTNLLRYLKNEEVVVSDLEVQRISSIEGMQEMSAMMTLTLCQRCPHKVTLGELDKLEGIKFLEEIF
nr:MgtC/SapB family protein [uncultured Cellulosilyticum sp.]